MNNNKLTEKELIRYNNLIDKFNLETDENKREKLMEKIGEFGWE